MEYMTHPKHGAQHAYDATEIERMEKAGWVKTKEPTAAEINAKKKGARAEALKAELAELETPVVAVAPVVAEKKKPGRKPKAAA